MATNNVFVNESNEVAIECHPLILEFENPNRTVEFTNVYSYGLEDGIAFVKWIDSKKHHQISFYNASNLLYIGPDIRNESTVKCINYEANNNYARMKPTEQGGLIGAPYNYLNGYSPYFSAMPSLLSTPLTSSEFDSKLIDAFYKFLSKNELINEFYKFLENNDTNKKTTKGRKKKEEGE